MVPKAQGAPQERERRDKVAFAFPQCVPGSSESQVGSKQANSLTCVKPEITLHSSSYCSPVAMATLLWILLISQCSAREQGPTALQVETRQTLMEGWVRGHTGALVVHSKPSQLGTQGWGVESGVSSCCHPSSTNTASQHSLTRGREQKGGFSRL